MFNPATDLIHTCIKQLQTGYRGTYGDLKPAYLELINHVAMTTLRTIAGSDALYHNLEHTVLVTLVGQEILRGKQLREGNVSCRDWAHFIVSLLCHDIGYVKGACSQDKPALRSYSTGTHQTAVVIEAGATDASLTAYHIDRGKRFVAETFLGQPLLDLAVIQNNIELTRFPVPAEPFYQETASYGGLTRAADLLGQLSDPRYLEKIPALFYEFAEVGTNQALGYRHPGDLRASYPHFFYHVVQSYVRQALYYLEATQRGQTIISNLYNNVAIVEQELQAGGPQATNSDTAPSCCKELTTGSRAPVS
mgnify:CR=1 FL=1